MSTRHLAVTDGAGNGLYQDEVCQVGTCLRPPGHDGPHDSFDGRAADAGPLHPLPTDDPRYSWYCERDVRQKQVYDWVRTTFGLANQDSRERVLRFFEEAVELAQAEGLSRADLIRVVQHVCVKPPGAIEQEAGGAGTTLLAYCASKGFSADAAERREFERVLAIPAEHFRQRHRVKSDAGIAIPCSHEDR